MSGAVFLSASIPDQVRGPEFAETADTVAIAAAVNALVYVVLGRRLLVWGGHPSITPMIIVVAEDLGIDYGSWVKLYQSQFFEDEYPDDNLKFQNVVHVRPSRTRDASLRQMRVRMLKDQQFESGIFIGGMQGVLDEWRVFSKLQPSAVAFPVASTGGAARLLAQDRPAMNRASDYVDRDYVSLFHRRLGISPRELRYANRELQPDSVEKRLWLDPI